jgi:predicted nucleic acid-binding Zn ribbon protein
MPEVIKMVDARKVKDMVAKKSSQFMGSMTGTGKMPPHKHCRICHDPIPVKAEPRVCKNQECIGQHEKDEKNQKAVRIAMFVFFGIFAIPYILVLVTRVLG